MNIKNRYILDLDFKNVLKYSYGQFLLKNITRRKDSTSNIESR